MNSLSIITMLCVCLILGCCTQGAQERKSGMVNSHHTIQLSSLFPSSSSSCVLSPKASSIKSSSLHVVDRHGPCSRLSNAKVASRDHADILRRDQARVDSIHSKNLKDQVMSSQSTKLPAKDGMTIGSANYIVTIGIGTPQQDQSLILDTGSDLTWIQCEPCLVSCYSQKEPKFDPSSSSSYTNVSCSSPVCNSLDSAGLPRDCLGSNCVYHVGYGDGSFSEGFLAKEKFTLTNSDVLDGINFGCGEYNTRFSGIAGLLGLGRNNLSFPSQTAMTYNNIFSYCLPSSATNTGHLTFGSNGISNSVKFTPISSVADSSFYGIEILGITVGNQKLDIPLTVFSAPGSIIDSGTVITRLPPKAYAALRSAFKAEMSNYTTTPGNDFFDTCYDLTGVDTITFPKIAFSFTGDVLVELDAIGIFYPLEKSLLCLAFKANDNDDETVIFGNVQQKTLEIVYDQAAGRVGFAPNGCT